MPFDPAHFDRTWKTPIPGGHASGSGGFLDIYNRRGKRPKDAALADPDNDPPASVDMARWEIDEVFEQRPLACSGNLGATDGRAIGYSYRWRAAVIWKFNQPPDLLLRGNKICALTFWMGQISQGSFKRADGAPNEDVQYPEDRYYWTPAAVIEMAAPVVDPNGKRMDRMALAGVCRAHLFLCPDQGTPDDLNTVAGAYFQWFKDQGR